MRLRFIDLGLVSPLRSQAAWYGFARRLKEKGEPVLTIVEPSEPYVCIGLHQDPDLELDREFCAANGIAIIRRRLGGGAVFLDRRQMIALSNRPKSLDVRRGHAEVAFQFVERLSVL